MDTQPIAFSDEGSRLFRMPEGVSYRSGDADILFDESGVSICQGDSLVFLDTDQAAIFADIIKERLS